MFYFYVKVQVAFLLKKEQKTIYIGQIKLVLTNFIFDSLQLLIFTSSAVNHHSKID